MALKGLTFPLWAGWLCGVVVLKRPWGPPPSPSWCTFSTFYCLFTLIMYVFLMADFLLNNSEGLTLGDEHKFGKYVRAFTLSQYVVITFVKKFAFLTNAKRLGRLLKILSEYEKDPERKKKYDKIWGWRKRSLGVAILIYSSFTISVISIITRGVEFIMENAKKPSWLKLLGLGRWGYGVIYFIYAVVPLGIASCVSYSVIMVISIQVGRIFCDFCCDVKESLDILIAAAGGRGIDGVNSRDSRNLEIYDILKMGSKTDYWDKKKKVHPAKGMGRNKISCLSKTVIEDEKNFPETFMSRQEVIDKFEELKDLMRLTNKTLSVLMLMMISGMTLGMVTNASSLLVTGTEHRHSPLNLVTDILTFPLLSIFAMLLELGHKIGRMQRKAKLELHREFMNTQWSLEKDEMEDVIQEIIEWDWKLSACGFFYVDRRLASGIFSLVLNYVVILVQLNIALTGTPPINCSTNVILTTTPASLLSGGLVLLNLTTTN